MNTTGSHFELFSSLPSLSIHWATRQEQVRISLMCVSQLLDSSFDSHFSIGADVSEQAAIYRGSYLSVHVLLNL